MTSEPVISTGTIIALGGVDPEEIKGTSMGVEIEDPEGKDLKKPSNFLESSVPPLLIQPTAPAFVFTKYHLSPPAPIVSPKGDRASP